MKLIIAGSRTITNYTPVNVTKWLHAFNLRPTEIVSGGARGIDELGERWAKLYGIIMKRFNPDWITHGKAAGPIRNQQMAEYADALMVVWDGKSRGTKNMMEEMKKVDKPIYVVAIPEVNE